MLGYIGRDSYTAMVLLTLIGSLTACTLSGFLINHLDLSPNFASVLIGLTNGLENITSILAPLSCGWIIDDPVSLFI